VGESPELQEEFPYQLVFLCGVDVQTAPAARKIVDITPEEENPESVLDRISEAGLTAADTKTTALLVVDGDPVQALIAFAAAAGYTGRYLDVATTEGEILRPAAVTAAARKLSQLGEDWRSANDFEPADELLVGPAAPAGIIYDSVEPLSVAASGPEAAQIRFARRVTVDVPSSMSQAVYLVAKLAGIRATRRVSDRFPQVLRGEEVIDLEGLRHSARAMRAASRFPDESELATPIKPTPVMERLAYARSLPIEPVLTALGSSSNETGEFWRCPRPTRHRNGDQNPSMRIRENRVRCFVCDSEWVDPVSLVMSVRKVGPSEAATAVIRSQVRRVA